MKTLLIITINILIATAIYAQDDRSKAKQIERFKAQKVAFITERVGMNSATAQKFWPVYNEFSEKMDSLISTRSHARKKLKKDSYKLTDKQKEAFLDIQIQCKWEEAKLERHYHEKFKKVLTIDQLIKLYEAEHEFRMRLIRQIRQSKAKSCKEQTDSELVSQLISCRGFAL